MGGNEMAVNYGACEQCWTVSWEPVQTEAECALRHPHEGDHVACEHCDLLNSYDAAMGKLAQIRQIIRDHPNELPTEVSEPIVKLTELG